MMSWHFRTRMMYVFTYFDVVLAHHWVMQSRYSDAGLCFVLPQEEEEVDEDLQVDPEVDPFHPQLQRVYLHPQAPSHSSYWQVDAEAAVFLTGIESPYAAATESEVANKLQIPKKYIQLLIHLLFI